MKHDSSSCIANEHCHHDQRDRKPIDHYFFGIYKASKDKFLPENPLFRRFRGEPLAFERNVGQTWELHRIVEKNFLYRIKALKTKNFHSTPFRQGSFPMPPLESPHRPTWNFWFFTYCCVPRFWLHYGENPTFIAVCVLELFILQSLAFYFEMDSSCFSFQ